MTSLLDSLQIVFEDNHLIIINKTSSQLVQGDATGDIPLSDLVKTYLINKYQKPGQAFIGVVHRLDRPTSGLVIFAKTSKALSRLNTMLQQKAIEKTYWALVYRKPIPASATLIHFLKKNESKNKSFITQDTKHGKQAILHYEVRKIFDRYLWLEIRLETGRHHQIRCQLASLGCPIVGDLKYGAPRSNPTGDICLHAQKIAFQHPVSKAELIIEAPVSLNHPFWKLLTEFQKSQPS